MQGSCQLAAYYVKGGIPRNAVGPMPTTFEGPIAHEVVPKKFFKKFLHCVATWAYRQLEGAAMPYVVHAQICIPRFSTDAEGCPVSKHPSSHYKRIKVGEYSTLRRAQRAAERTTHVYLDEAQTRLCTLHHIHVFEIDEIP